MPIDKFYITTPIYYINDKPHIGTAYTTIVADTLARWWRQRGEDVLFLAGVDEHSQKTVDAAKKTGEEIGAYTDRLVKAFESVWEQLHISNTDFIRTTEDRHVAVVRNFWERMDVAGDIYLGKYEGLYCKGCEEFKKEEDLIDGVCPEHKVAPEFVSEENYFFRLSKYQKQLLEFYEANENFVAPMNRFQEVKSFVEAGLEDVSFSRENRDWGIQVPNDPHQVIYVWTDALVNYISSVGVEGWEEHPADIHVVGKNILRFHAVIWPAMLMSAGLPLPGQIIANGFLTAEGVKISKSLGNAIDPLDLTARYGVDALRYFLLREIPFGQDGDFSEKKMKERYNADLANGLGNFASRVLTLAEKETLVFEPLDDEFEKQISAMKIAVAKKISDFKFNEALMAVWDTLAFGDFYINEKKIWAIADDATRKHAIFNCVTLLDNIAAALLPFMPETSNRITDAIKWDKKTLNTKKIDTLFPRIK